MVQGDSAGTTWPGLRLPFQPETREVLEDYVVVAIAVAVSLPAIVNGHSLRDEDTMDVLYRGFMRLWEIGQRNTAQDAHRRMRDLLQTVLIFNIFNSYY